jgi:hypothetical protein
LFAATLFLKVANWAKLSNKLTGYKKLLFRVGDRLRFGLQINSEDMFTAKRQILFAIIEGYPKNWNYNGPSELH